MIISCSMRVDHSKGLTASRNGYRPFQRGAVGQLNPMISKEFYPNRDEAVHLPYAAILLFGKDEISRPLGDVSRHTLHMFSTFIKKLIHFEDKKKHFNSFRLDLLFIFLVIQIEEQQRQ
uniref:Uncharacterized protein n=1 Tax=Glossina austeni TaxID=7395 RepID=A0A1A9V4N8_GLOAU